MQIKLDCGIKVSVTSFHFYKTYGGLLAGLPNQRINKKIVEAAQVTEVFGKGQPTYLIPAVIDESGEYPCLPPYILSAWLVDWCLESHLVVVWFRDGFGDLPFSQVIGDAVKTLAWHDLAGEYWF